MSQKRQLLPLVPLLVLAFLFTGGQAAELRLLYFNDFHGYAESFHSPGREGLVGGAAYLAGTIQRLRRERPSLLLAAGDMIAGHAWANFTKGQGVIDLLNLMRPTAMVLGNHEFDFGVKILRLRLAAARFPVLGANVVGLAQIKPYLIREVAGLRVAILGVVTEDTPIITAPRNVAGLRFLPAAETVARYLPQLRRKAELVLVLSHLGYYADRALAAAVKGLDVIVGGHSHTRLDQPELVNGTIIVQAWEYGKVLGLLDLVLDQGRIISFAGRLQPIGPAEGPAYEDKAARALVRKYSRRVNAVLNRKIGVSLCDLQYDKVRRQETNFGDFIADIIRETADADVALINSGAIRNGLSRGELKLKDLYSALPYDNRIVALKLSGAQIREILEHGLAALPEASGAFLQVSGLRFTYRPQAPPGRRLQEVAVADQPLDPEREYTVATIDFLLAGGDGYQTFKESLGPEAAELSPAGLKPGGKLIYADVRYLRDVVADYIRKHQVINPRTSGRIQALAEP